MSRNLIIYKVEYRLRSDPWERGKHIKTKRIVMTPDEVNQTGGYWRNHSRVSKKFFDQMETHESNEQGRYSIWSIKKAWKKLN